MGSVAFVRMPQDAEQKGVQAEDSTTVVGGCVRVVAFLMVVVQAVGVRGRQEQHAKGSLDCVSNQTNLHPPMVITACLWPIAARLLSGASEACPIKQPQ